MTEDRQEKQKLNQIGHSKKFLYFIYFLHLETVLSLIGSVDFVIPLDLLCGVCTAGTEETHLDNVPQHKLTVTVITTCY